MIDLPHERLDGAQPTSPFEGFKAGRLVGFRFFYDAQSDRIFRFLFRQTSNRLRSRDLTIRCFIVLLRNHTLVKDEAHLVRVLYLLAKMGVVLELLEPAATERLLKEWIASGRDGAEIMDDPAVKRNETSVAFREIKKLPARVKIKACCRNCGRPALLRTASKLLALKKLKKRSDVKEMQNTTVIKKVKKPFFMKLKGL